MPESASRGFWVASYAPYGYARVMVQDGPKKRPRLEPDPPAAAVVKRIFQMALQGKSSLDITKTLNSEGIASPKGNHWLKTSVHRVLSNEAYTGTLVSGASAKDNAEPVRVEGAFPALVSVRDFRQVANAMRSKAPTRVQPRRASSPLPAERAGQLRDLRQGPHRARGQERQVHLLRLPLPAQEGLGDVQDAQAQLQELRGPDRRQHPGEHPHGEQHPRPREAGGRGDGRHRP